jgi:hypothetical protein
MGFLLSQGADGFLPIELPVPVINAVFINPPSRWSNLFRTKSKDVHKIRYIIQLL